MAHTEDRNVLPWKIAVVLLLVAVIVLGMVTLHTLERKNLVESAVTTLCGAALTDVELNLQQGDAIAPEYLYRLHEITRVYPDTNYARLSNVLLALTDKSLSAALTQDDRIAIADCISASNDPSLYDQELEPLIDQIQCILAPYQYT